MLKVFNYFLKINILQLLHFILQKYKSCNIMDIVAEKIYY